VSIFNDGYLSMVERTKEREAEIINIIKEFWKEHHYSPTIREIAENASINSPSTVSRYLNRLQEKGIIEWKEKTSRTITIIEGKSSAN
jgi:repressor LexA